MTTMTKAALAGLATTFCVQSASAEQIDVGLLLPFSGVYASLGNDIEAGFLHGEPAFFVSASQRRFPGRERRAHPVRILRERAFLRDRDLTFT